MRSSVECKENLYFCACSGKRNYNLNQLLSTFFGGGGVCWMLLGLFSQQHVDILCNCMCIHVSVCLVLKREPTRRRLNSATLHVV